MSSSSFRTRPARLRTIVAGGACLIIALAACAADEEEAVTDTTEASAGETTESTEETEATDTTDTTEETETTETTETASSGGSETSGTLVDAADGGDAVSYDPDMAPLGAELVVAVEEGDETTLVELEVAGLLPDRGYAAHLHVNTCGATGADAGPHFQAEVDPAAGPDAPSSDPAFANPENEIWLDVETDADGAGTSSAEVPFAFGTDGPASLIIHANEATATAAGEAGSAGPRVACMTLAS